MSYFKGLTILFAVFALSISANAQEKLSGRSRLVIDSYNNQPDAVTMKRLPIKSIEATGIAKLQSTIVLNDEKNVPLDKLSELGVEISAQIGAVLTAEIPINSFDAVCALSEVKSVEIAKKMKIRMDNARTLTNAVQVNAGTGGITQAYTGKGVVIGIVDTGIDYTHPNFKDANGNSRIKRVYNPGGYGSVTVGGITLKGTEYTTDAAIAALKYDVTSESHGSHTSGIAGGSYTASNFQGMAPEADLVLCGLGDKLYDSYIINAIKYIFAYAKSVGKPAVVNLSLGYHNGPHDGTSSDCVAYDELAKDGIIVISTGNEGTDKLYINKTFTNTTDAQLKTFLSSKYSSTDPSVYYADSSQSPLGFDFWSRNNTRFGVQFVVFDKSTKTVLATSNKFYPNVDTSSSYSWSSTADANLAKYFTGKIDVEAGLQSNNKYNVYFQVSANPVKASSYYIGVNFFGNEGTIIDGWNEDSGCDFASFYVSGYTAGNSSYSVSDMATGFKTLSIGAYCSKAGFKVLDGTDNTYTLDNNTAQGQICDFSSYGVDVNGYSHPDVTAPGMAVISSVNSYDTSNYPRTESSYEATYNNRKYRWAAMAGTSMAAPAATGIIALWLQANPSLGVEDVRTIIKETSITDSNTAIGLKSKWGAGKINALAGVIKALNTTGINDVASDKNVMMVYPNPSNGQFSIYAQNCEGNVTLNIYGANGALAYTKVMTPDNQGLMNVDLEGQLSAGVYIVQVVGNNTSHTSRLIIK